MVVIGLSAGAADVEGSLPVGWRIIYTGAKLIALLGTPLLIGYVHARSLKHRMGVRPVALAWIIGTLPLALIFGITRGEISSALAVVGLALLQAALGTAGTMLGCRVGLAEHDRRFGLQEDADVRRI
jgi:hypothetical protein